MLRISIIASSLALSACAPSFDDKLAGTWDCKPDETVPNVQVNYALTYTKAGEITGEMTVDEQAGEQNVRLRGTLAGTWEYDGETLAHTTTEKFEELSVDGEAIPREEIDPQLIQGFREQEGEYDDPVDLVDDELIWYADAGRETVSIRCTKRDTAATTAAEPEAEPRAEPKAEAE